MRILVTGAFGNIGKYLINELMRQNHNLKCFVLPDKKNRKIAQKIKNVEIFYGDIRKVGDIKKAISGCDAVIHLAFTPPDLCQRKPQFSYKINVIGTKNLVKVINENTKETRLVFASSISAYFYEKYKNSKKFNFLRYKNYTEQKIKCENIIKSSLSQWCILRLGAILPTDLSTLKNIFSIPYNAYFEFIHIKDVVTALINATRKDKAVRKVLLIGGGKKLCIQYKKFVDDLFSLYGYKLPKNNKFSPRPYLTGCFDTKESQDILKYQKHSYKDFLLEMRQQMKKMSFDRITNSMLK
jgi:nucleoside-diphosphate-sugar epimerase